MTRHRRERAGARGGNAGEGAFDPLAVLSYFWRTDLLLEESDTTTPEDGEDVTRWTDQIAATPLTPPVWPPTYDEVNAAFGGRPTLAMTAVSGQGMQAATVAPWAFLHSECTIFVRLSPSASIAANAVILSSSDVAISSQGIALRRENSTQNIRLFISDGTSFVVDISGGTMAKDGAVDEITARISADRCDIALNHTEIASVENGTSPYTLPTGNPAYPFAFGRRGVTNSQVWAGDFEFIGIANSYFSDAEVAEWWAAI